MPSYADTVSVDDGFDALSYGYSDSRGAPSASAIHSERDLWCAVIAQAFVDIGAIVPVASNRAEAQKQPADSRAFDEAVRWLLRDKRDFAYICELAGVSPHIIRCAAQMFYGRRQLALGALYTQKGDGVT